MSTVFDVTSIVVDGGTPAAFDTAIDTVTISDVTTTPSVTISNPETVDVVNIEVPGMQGPPGLKNVYIQSENPATQYGWGIEETNFIWIPIS